MQYEAPRILRRERIDALLSPVVLSVYSDVNRKENVVEVVW